MDKVRKPINSARSAIFIKMKTHRVLGILNLRWSESCIWPLHRLWEVDVSTKTAANSTRGNLGFWDPYPKLLYPLLMYSYLFIFLLFVFSLCWSVQSLCTWCKCTFVPSVCHIQIWTLQSSAVSTCGLPSLFYPFLWNVTIVQVSLMACCAAPLEMTAISCLTCWRSLMAYGLLSQFNLTDNLLYYINSSSRHDV
jgi:hypothetical protein